MAIDSGLFGDLIQNKVIETLKNRLAPLSDFSTDFSDEQVKQEGERGITVTVPLTSGNTAYKNPTNYEPSAEIVIDPRVVTLNEHYVPWSISSPTYNKSKLADVMKVVGENAAKLADAIWAEVAALLTVANFTNTPVDVTAANFTTAELRTLWASLSKATTKSLVLDPTYYSQIMPTNKDGFALQAGAFGFDSINYVSDFSAASNGIIGFAADKSAFAMASRVPFLPASVAAKIDQISLFDIPELGITVQMCDWGTTAGRTAWMSLGAYFGVSKGLTAALTPITDGAT